MKREFWIFVFVFAFLAAPISTVKAQSIPTLFNAQLNGEDAYAYLSDYFEIYWRQDFHDDLQVRGGESVRPVTSPRDVPQQVLWVGNHLEEARRMVVQVMKYRHPVGALNNKLPVVIDALPDGLFGFASIRPDGTPYLVVNPLLDDQVLKSTLAHEYFHAVQFGYDETTHLLYADMKPNEPFRIPTKMAEGSALWIMNRAFPDSLVYRDFFAQSAIVHPHLSIFGEVDHSTDGNQTTYGTFLWYHFLSKRFGEGIVKELWEEQFQLSKATGASTVPFAVRAYRAHVNVLSKLYQTDLKTVFEEFMLWNVFTEKYRESAKLPPLKLMFEASLLPIDRKYTEGDLPEAFGSNYLKINTKGKFDRVLRFEFAGAPEGSYSLMMIPFRGSEGVEESIVRADSLSGAATTVELELDRYDYVVIALGMSGVGEQVLNRDDPFSGIRYQYGFSVSDVDPLLEAKGKVEQTQLLKADGSMLNGDLRQEDPLNVESVQDVIKGSVVDLSRPSFADVVKRHPYFEGIEGLYRTGVIAGYEDGSFKPQQTVNRAEMTKMVMEALGTKLLVKDKNCFPDVKTEWFATYVCAAKRLGIVGGFPDGRFGPGEVISTAAAYKIVLEAWFESIPETTGPWFSKYFAFASDRGLGHSTRVEPSKSMTRGEMAQLVWNVMERGK
jgi:hypothetical protein